jgi:hypothetical protein
MDRAKRLATVIENLSQLAMEDYEYAAMSQTLRILIPLLKREDIPDKFYDKLTNLESMLIKESALSNVPS